MRKLPFYLTSLLALLLTSLLGCSSSTATDNDEAGAATTLTGPAFVLFYTDN